MNRKSLILLVLSAFVVLIGLNGCSKSAKYYKLFGLEEMTYIVAEESAAVDFFNELGAVMTKYDGTDIKEFSMKSDISKVVRKHNNNVVSGTFYLKKSYTSDDGPWSNVTSWTMKFASKYYSKAGDVDFKTFAESGE